MSDNIVNAGCGVLYIAVGVVLVALAASEGWDVLLVVPGAVNLACGARMLGLAYREVYHHD